MFSMFYPFFPLQASDILNLEVLDFLLLINFSILELFLTWHLRLARVTVCMYVSVIICG